MTENQTTSAQTNEAQAEAAPAKTTIRPDMSRYVPDKSGNGKRTHRTDDFVARTLAGKSVEDVKRMAGEVGIDVAKWEHLNPGQQRMLIGNRLRTLMVAKENPLTEEAITKVFGEPVAAYDAEAAAKAKADREAQAAQKKIEKEAQAAAKAKAAAKPEPTDAEGQDEGEKSDAPDAAPATARRPRAKK